MAANKRPRAVYRGKLNAIQSELSVFRIDRQNAEMLPPEVLVAGGALVDSPPGRLASPAAHAIGDRSMDEVLDYYHVAL
jgi:hypothetical protein